MQVELLKLRSHHQLRWIKSCVFPSKENHPIQAPRHSA
jgi:hypothetical protein